MYIKVCMGSSKLDESFSRRNDHMHKLFGKGCEIPKHVMHRSSGPDAFERCAFHSQARERLQGTRTHRPKASTGPKMKSCCCFEAERASRREALVEPLSFLRILTHLTSIAKNITYSIYH